MRSNVKAWLGVALLLCASATLAGTRGDACSETVSLFRNAGESAAYFDNSYGYAVFPTIGKAGWGIGGAHDSQIVFFQDRRAFDEFSRGNFAFGADVNAVAITAAAGGTVGTEGAGAEASGGEKDARTLGGYYKGVAVFTIVKGGAMFQATVAGQKFSYTPKA